jgi:cytochrome c biogenesis protein ResB
MVRALSSLYLFFALCAGLAAAFVYQTLFNRGVPVYGSAWFAALGLALAANVLACSLRWARAASAHFLLLHAGIVVIIAGSFLTRLYRFEGQLPLHTGETSALALTQGATYELPFSVRLDNFSLDYYAEPSGQLVLEEAGARKTFDAREGLVLRPASGGTVKVLRLARDFGLTARNEVVEKSPYWFNPAVQVEVNAGGRRKKLWFFSNFPNMHEGGLPFALYYSLEQAEIRSYTSSVTITPNGGVPVRAEISVNRPLRFGGYTLYQTSYDPADASYSLLTVARDRGLWTVYAGFAIFLTGVLLWLRR